MDNTPGDLCITYDRLVLAESIVATKMHYENESLSDDALTTIFSRLNVLLYNQKILELTERTMSVLDATEMLDLEEDM